MMTDKKPEIIEQIRVIRLLCWPNGKESNPNASTIWAEETRRLREKYNLTCQEWQDLMLESN